MANNLTASLPYYITRKDADGRVASYSMSAWMILVAQLLVWLNLIGWSVYGIVELVDKVV